MRAITVMICVGAIAAFQLVSARNCGNPDYTTTKAPHCESGPSENGPYYPNGSPSPTPYTTESPATTSTLEPTPEFSVTPTMTTPETSTRSTTVSAPP